MATKAAAKKDPVALVRKPAAKELSWKDQGDTVLGRLAEEMGRDLAPSRLGEIVSTIRTWEADLEALKKNAQQRLTDLVMKEGNVKTEKGSRELVLDGWRLEVRPWRTGYDDKKVESLLRNKGLDPSIHMQQTIIYKANPEKLAFLAGNGELTKDELELSRYDEKWVLQTPKKVGGNDE